MLGSVRRALRVVSSLPQQVAHLYADTRTNPRLRKPVVIQFPVNDVCNSRCQMCFIWERKKSRELTPAEVHRIFSDSLFSDVRALGINGGEPTLRRDLGALVAAAADALPRLAHVSLITNAIQRDRVIARVIDIGQETRARGISLDVMVSIDGVGDIHDAVRGRPGNFRSATAVIDHLRSEPLVDSIRIGCTITSLNASYGEELLEWAIVNKVYARFRIAVPHNRLYNRDRSLNYVITDSDPFPILMLLDRLSREYETDWRRASFYRNLLNQLAYGAPRTAGCAWRNHGATLLADGGLAYCAVESPRIGNALDEPSTGIYWRQDHIRRHILETKCSGCQHDYDGPSDFDRELADLLGSVPGMRKVIRKGRAALRRTTESFDLVREVAGERTASVAAKIRPRSSRPDRGEGLLLTGWYGTETVGDQAILGGILDVARDVHDGPIAVASLEPFITARTLDLLGRPPDVTTLPYSAAQAKIEAGWARAVAMAGGPLMGTIPEIRLLARVLRGARRAGIPTGLLGIGIGPLGGPLERSLIGEIIGASDVVTTRDHDSASYAADSGRHSNVTEAGDPSLIWLDRIRDSLAPRPPGSRPNLGVAIRRWPIYEYGGGRFTDEMRAALESTIKRDLGKLESRFQLLPIAMGFVHVGGDDRRLLRELLGSDRSSETALHSYPTPLSVAQTIANCDALIAMRYHAAVFGIAFGVPTLAIEYTGGGKLAALHESFPQLRLVEPVNLAGGEIPDAVASLQPFPRHLVREMTDNTRSSLRSAVAALVS